MVAVDEIGVRARSEPVEHRMRPRRRRHAARSSPYAGFSATGSDGRDRRRPRPRIQPRPSTVSNSRPRDGHQLHADADAEKRPAAPDDRLAQRLFQARAPRRGRGGNRRTRRPRAGRCARRRRPRPGRLVTTIALADPALGRGALERLRRRAQIARAVIDDRGGHPGHPGCRRACPWSTAPRRRAAGRSRPPGAAPAPAP